MKQPARQTTPDFAFERSARAQGFRQIAGVDEAGRGPLAGPVVAAACILPDAPRFAQLNDSKKLSAKQRGELYQLLTSDEEVVYAIKEVSAELIDQVNILQATYIAMRSAVSALAVAPDYLLVDGAQLPGAAAPSLKIIKGDAKSLSIAAASILAKVYRDALMMEYHERWPEYGFDAHKGYGTAAHVRALESHGPSPIHRKSFKLKKSSAILAE